MLKKYFAKGYEETYYKGREIGMNDDQLELLLDAKCEGRIQGLNWGSIAAGAAAIAAGVVWEFVVPGVKKLFSKKDK